MVWFIIDELPYALAEISLMRSLSGLRRIDIGQPVKIECSGRHFFGKDAHRAANAVAGLLLVLFKLDIGIRTGLDLVHDIDDCRPLVDRLIPKDAQVF